MAFTASGSVKLIDFGLATRVPRVGADGNGQTGDHTGVDASKPAGEPQRMAQSEESTLLDVCGSVEYMAPEVLRLEGYGAAVDWWSFGCLLFELNYGFTPWVMRDDDGTADYSLDEAEVASRIIDLNHSLAFPQRRPVPRELRAILSCLLQRSPSARLGSHSSGEAVRAHPYFAAVDWVRLDCGELKFPPVPTLEYASSAAAAAQVLDAGGITAVEHFFS